MSGSRPIPISNGRSSQRSSPASDMVSPTGALISQSLPADVHLARFRMPTGGAVSRFQPPQTPVFGSLPAPTFLNDRPMEELMLPPRNVQEFEERAPRPVSVIQFPSSCPSDMGYLRGGNPMRNPMVRPMDTFDLSTSPGFAAISFRDRSSSREFSRMSARADDYSIHTVTEEMREHLNLDEESEEEEVDMNKLLEQESAQRPDRRGSYDDIFDLEE